MVATLSGRAPLKGLTAAGLGLMIAMVGSRAQSGTLRWTFDWLYLWDGVPLIPATLGHFRACRSCANLRCRASASPATMRRNINLSSQWEGVRDVGAQLVAGAALRRARHRAWRHSRASAPR